VRYGDLPDGRETFVVVVQTGVGVTEVAVAVEHHAVEPKLGHAPLQFGR
jgi:hypothetical protein